ncbi:MAG: hypothetical protein K8F31_01890 [Roseovarius sp.]|nr:MAG: hypothetical protein F9K50_00905 [bacterium]MBZ0122621.1 hypothetical protein [Roseovarius sp.]
MKSVALHVPISSHHAGFWTLFRGFFHVQPFRSIMHDSALPQGEPLNSDEDILFFKEEEELEAYVRSFRE